MQIKVTSGRLSFGDRIFKEGDVLTVDQSPAIDALIRYGNIEVIGAKNVKVVVPEVAVDLDGDGEFTKKDKSIASKVMRKIVRGKQK